MGQAKTTIELNGKIYDTATGEVVGQAPSAAPTSANTGAAKNLDGFFKPGNSLPADVVKPEAKSSSVKKVHSSQKSNRQPSKPTKHQLEKSQTLMRHAVKKPELTVKEAAPAKQTADKIDEPTKPNQLPTILADRQQERAARAQQYQKSQRISKFSQQPTKVSTSVSTLAVQPHPEEQLESVEPSVDKAQTSVAAAIEAPETIATPPASQPHTGSAAFHAALANAQSHRLPATKKSKLQHRAAKKMGVTPKTLSIIVGSLVAVIIAGLVAYKNIPAISMQLAASRAGFQAALPQNVPAGFSLKGPINTSPGQVIVSFHSTTDDRSFQVIQKPSNWTSETLLNSFVATTQKNYQTIQEKGKTIFIMGNTATWVNGGTWYQITGNANLNSQQVRQIADGL